MVAPAALHLQAVQNVKGEGEAVRYSDFKEIVIKLRIEREINSSFDITNFEVIMKGFCKMHRGKLCSF